MHRLDKEAIVKEIKAYALEKNDLSEWPQGDAHRTLCVWIMNNLNHVFTHLLEKNLVTVEMEDAFFDSADQQYFIHIMLGDIL